MKSYNGAGNGKRDMRNEYHKNLQDWATEGGSPSDAAKLPKRRTFREHNFNSLREGVLHSLTRKYRESGGIKDLGYTRVHGKTRYNDAKNAEIKDRVSM